MNAKNKLPNMFFSIRRNYFFTVLFISILFKGTLQVAFCSENWLQNKCEV